MPPQSTYFSDLSLCVFIDEQIPQYLREREEGEEYPHPDQKMRKRLLKGCMKIKNMNDLFA